MLKFKISHCWNRIYCQMQGTSQSANLFIWIASWKMDRFCDNSKF
jgi:hypothetical protein